MPQITNFSLNGLYDLYDYKDCRAEGRQSDLLILYGDNGCGKTTILNLIFHLLSTASGRGHLNSIARIPFKSLTVNLSDETIISAERKENATSYPIKFRITKPSSEPVEYNFIPERVRERILQEVIEREYAKSKNTKYFSLSKVFNPLSHPERALMPNSDDLAHDKYLTTLKQLGLTCYFMAADRKMRSDQIVDEDRSSRILAMEGDQEDRDVIARVRTRYLEDALSAASKYMNMQVINASNAGSKNTNEIYAELIKRIATDSNIDQPSINNDRGGAAEALKGVETRNHDFADLGIVPELDFGALHPILKAASPNNRAILDKVLWPYIDSLSARLDALEPVGDVIQTFLTILNSLFRDKLIRFSPATGFTLIGPKRQTHLEANQLSSGEQQLLLMFCYLLISNESDSIFMIDEPEISLNVKWQRDLIDAMRKITKGSNNQIVLATHSIELLAQHDEMVVELNPTLSINESVKEYESPKKDN